MFPVLVKLELIGIRGKCDSRKQAENMAAVGRPPNPENEALRRSVEGPPDIQGIVTTLVQTTSRIHSAFLFESYSREVLQKLCLLLSATRTSFQYHGWESFGCKLGLNQDQIKCINFHFNMEDPAYFILKAFAQRRDSTMDKIITTLKSIGRDDIILQMSSLFTRLVDDVLRNHETSSREESGYFSLEYDDQSEESRYTVISPRFFPTVPLILQDFSSPQAVANIPTQIPYTEVENNSYQMADMPSKSRSKYAKKVMLTFALDGEETASKIAAIFRQERNLKRIGVVILNDHVGKVNSNPEQFIFSCFDQVDYVIPVITEGYLAAVSAKRTSIDTIGSAMNCIDPQYVKYIYTLMITDYLHNGCINAKVRCIVPDCFLHLIYNHPLMKSPLFQAWVKQSETEQLSKRILASKF